MASELHVATEATPRTQRGGAHAPDSPSRTSGVRPRAAAAVTPELTGSALTVLRRILPERKQELTSLLTRIGQDIDGAQEMNFAGLASVHFMRWVVVEPTGSEPAQLAFESNYDGTLQEHLDDLYRCGARCMHEVYRCCEGYPFAGQAALPEADIDAAQAFLKQGALRPEAFYVGRCGKSARRIRLEGALRDAIQLYLDGLGSDPLRHFGGDPQRAYAAILEHLQAQHAPALQQLQAPGAPPPQRQLLPILLRGLCIVPPLLLSLPVLYPILRYKEETDRAESYGVLPEQTRQLAEREDFQVQNQLTHLVRLKPGPFRLFVLRIVLYVIDILARYWFISGDLDGLNTIHFARWVLIDEGKRLLFFSNYDGSWERYLGDFVDQEHIGLTSVWSNTEGYPKTSNLLLQGATDEERFKAWTRAHQIPTQLWYSAYPQLTTPNIGRNGRICAGLLDRPATRQALEDWLMLL